MKITLVQVAYGFFLKSLSYRVNENYKCWLLLQCEINKCWGHKVKISDIVYVCHIQDMADSVSGFFKGPVKYQCNFPHSGLNIGDFFDYWEVRAPLDPLHKHPQVSKGTSQVVEEAVPLVVSCHHHYSIQSLFDT